MWHPPTSLRLCEGRAHKMYNGLCPPFCLVESCPQCCIDARHFSSSLCATGAFQAATLCWSSEGVSLSIYMCGFLKKNCLRHQRFLPLTQPPPFFFFSQKLWGFIFLAWNPGLGALVWCWDSSLPRYPSWIFIHHTWLWDQPILHLHNSAPPTSLGGCGLFNFYSCRTSIHLNFWWFWVMVVLQFSCNFEVVVWAGEPCLSTPPSQREEIQLVFN